MKENLTKRLVKTALIAAIYAVLTVILAPISYGPIQFRLSEILVLFAFIDPIYIIGLTLGCFLANLFGGLGIMDLIFGTLATFLSVSAISLTAKIVSGRIISLIIFGWMLSYVLELPLILTMLQVGIGEFVVVSLIGVPVFKIITDRYRNRLALE